MNSDSELVIELSDDNDTIDDDTLDDVPTCPGCIDDQPNQLAHMVEGGCLYHPSEDEEVQSPEPEQIISDEVTSVTFSISRGREITFTFNGHQVQPNIQQLHNDDSSIIKDALCKLLLLYIN